MSSSSDDATYLAVVPGNQNPRWFCSLLSKERESKKPDNPGRRFYNCPKSLVAADACRFFMWKDPPLNQHYKDFINRLNKQLVDMNSTAEVERLQRKLEKEKSMRQNANARIQELEMELTQLKVKMKMALVVVLVCLVGIVFGLKFR